MEKINKTLQEAGLSPKESAIYLALLALGSGSVLEVSKKSRINRSLIYESIERLIQKKLVTVSISGKRKIFSAEHPDKIITLLKEKLTAVHAALPELISLTHHGSKKPIIRYVEGIEMIQEIFLEAARARTKEIRAFVGIEHLLSKSRVLETFWKTTYQKQKAKHGVFSWLILPDTPEGKTFRENDATFLRETRFLPGSSYNFPGEILLYDNTVALFSYNKKEEFVLTIESETIAETVKMIWKVVWNASY